MFMDSCKVFILITVASTIFAQDDYCQEGIYGNNCELKCSEQCHPHQTFPCNKKTGKCTEGCMNGYYGGKCDIMCSCPSGVCLRENGECIGTGTTSVRSTKNTTQNILSTTEAPVCEGVAAVWRTITIILITFIIILAFGGVTMFLYLRFKKQEITLRGTWKIKFSKASDDDVSRDEETGKEPAKTPLVHKKADEDATGGQREIQEPRGHQSEENPTGFKQVDELKQQGRLLREAEIQTRLDLPLNSNNILMSSNEMKRTSWLQCPNVKFDEETVNVKFAYIDDKMVLWNIPDQKNPEYNGRRFQQFQGATCTGPLVNEGLYQYFETIFDIGLHQSVGEGIIAQFGLCGDKEANTPFIDTKVPCLVVEVATCIEHNKICLLSINNGKTTHMQELMNNVAGSGHRVHIGIRLKNDMKRIQIFDCKERKSVLKTDIIIGEKIWPMFGLCTMKEASVSVKLIAEHDIKLDKEKKEMIKSKYM